MLIDQLVVRAESPTAPSGSPRIAEAVRWVRLCLCPKLEACRSCWVPSTLLAFLRPFLDDGVRDVVYWLALGLPNGITAWHIMRSGSNKMLRELCKSQENYLYA